MAPKRKVVRNTVRSMFSLPPDLMNLFRNACKEDVLTLSGGARKAFKMWLKSRVL